MSKAKILVIDDEEVILETMKDRLMLEGFHVATAASGKEGIEMAAQEKPDLIILDIMLPDMTGHEVCRTLKAGAQSSVPIILATSKIDAVDATKAREAGAQEFTVKTMDYEPLMSAVKKLLSDE